MIKLNNTIPPNFPPYEVSIDNTTMSTEHVTMDEETGQATIRIPEKIADMISSQKCRIQYVEECRRSDNPSRRHKFPEGGVEVLDTDKFFKEIENIKRRYMFEPTRPLTVAYMEEDLQTVFENFTNREYVKYI